jgi:carbonic anhydrase/acetyltransferase-like protein (isoleucine patch superfamily)
MSKSDFPTGFKLETPVLDPSVFVASGARLIGNITIGKDSSVWYNSVLRGDINRILIGASSNIQDGVIVHLENELGCSVGNYVTVGHGAILHGCAIEDAVVVGMGAVVLNGAVIGTGSIVGAGAVIKEGAQIPPFSLVVGVPGKIVRTLPLDTVDKNIAWAIKYVRLAQEHQKMSSESK